jgi:tetratricopeptide (TPR) repeat protein
MAQLHYWLGGLRHRQGHWVKAAEHCTAAAELYQVLGDTFWLPRVWRLLSEQYRERGEWQQAEALGHQARVVQEQNGDALGLAATYSALGHVAFRRNDLDEALHWLQQALAIPDLAQEPETEAGVRARLGNIYNLRADFAQARHHYEASRAIAEREGDDGSLSTVLLNLGVLYGDFGDIATAIDLTIQAREHFIRCGDLQGIALVHLNLSATYQDIGEFAIALTEGEQAIRLTRQLGDLTSLSLAFHNQARSYLLQGDYANAQVLNDEAATVHQSLTGAVAEGDLIAWQQALLLANSGANTTVLPQLRQLFARIANYSSNRELFSNLLDLVEFTLAAEHWTEAAEWLAQARTIALDYARTDFIGLVEQWAGDAARLQGEWAQAQHHYDAARQAFAGKDDVLHRYLLKTLQEHLAPLLAEGDPIASCGSERANFGEPLA